MKKMVRTPAKLDSCKITWPFQDAKTHKNLHMCVKCKADAPLALAIAVNGKRVIWICNANRFKKKEECEKRMSWLGNETSATGSSTKKVCVAIVLRKLVSNNEAAAKVFEKHNKHLELGQETKSESLYQRFVNIVINVEAPKRNRTKIVGATAVNVEISVLAARYRRAYTRVFVVISHSVRSCGRVPGQPPFYLDSKKSKCIWSKVACAFSEFQPGKGLKRFQIVEPQKSTKPALYCRRNNQPSNRSKALSPNQIPTNRSRCVESRVPLSQALMELSYQGSLSQGTALAG